MSIGVFDSGLGGLSVLGGLRNALPQHDMLYLSDSGYAPYGQQPPELILQRAIRMTDFLLAHGVGLLVMACNTATSIAAKAVRDHVTIPVVAMEPALKPAKLLTQTGKVAVLATAHTLSSDNLAQLTASMPDIQWVLTVCPGWVEAVERGDFESDRTQGLIRHVVDRLLANGVDTLVLGCTHYPFLKPALFRLYGESLHIVDATDGVTNRVVSLVRSHGLLPGNGHSVGWSSRSDVSYWDRMKALGIDEVMPERF